MAKETKDKHFIKKPVYPGGSAALKNFITSKLSYPKDALENKVEGTVFLKYTINYKGIVTEARVISSLGYGCDEEAIRLVKMLKFKVEKVRGVKIQFHKNIQIHFRLPIKNEQKISYSFTSSDTKQSANAKLSGDSEKNTGNSYNYTIEW